MLTDRLNGFNFCNFQSQLCHKLFYISHFFRYNFAIVSGVFNILPFTFTHTGRVGVYLVISRVSTITWEVETGY